MMDNAKTPKFSLRVKALFFDWLFICVYLFLLFILTVSFYFIVLNKIPEFTVFQSQLVATLTSVVPITIIFSMMEGTGNKATWGKKKTGLIVEYKDKSMRRSFIRNVFKFLPWQFGHMSTISGIYNGFDTVYSIIFFTLSMGLVVIYLIMVFKRKDGRHLGDLIAGSQVTRI